MRAVQLRMRSVQLRMRSSKVIEDDIILLSCHDIYMSSILNNDHVYEFNLE